MSKKATNPKGKPRGTAARRDELKRIIDATIPMEERVGLAAELARGKTVDHETDSGSALVTRDNMYTEENQEILFPFY